MRSVFVYAASLFGLFQQPETFEAWQERHGKVYEDFSEAEARRAVWAQSLDQVRAHNDGVASYWLEMNEFADLTHEEFSKTYLMIDEDGKPQGCSATDAADGWQSEFDSEALPTRVDWRDKGVVSAVKNQQKCGSCWSFSTTGALEAHTAIHYGKHVLFSEQQLVDCAGAFNNDGCNGGLPSRAFEYIHYAGGLETEDEYPYKAKTGSKCLFDKGSATLGHVKDVANITTYDEKSLAMAVAKVGPVSVAFQVASDFRLYGGGVYDSNICKSEPKDVNHAVLAVGFDEVSEHGKTVPYWWIKNSWGASWGVKGYFKLVRGKNECGISDCASMPILK